MKEELIKHILDADFEEAVKIAWSMPHEDLSEHIIEAAFDRGSLIFYTFVCHMITKYEDFKLHDLAFVLLASPLCHLEGAYFSALFHARKSVELTEQKDIGSLEQLVFLQGIPDPVLSDEEAISACRKILQLDPEHETATEILKELCQ
ncbi:hypothetical protein [Peribacillus sp. SCS-155]|uniref:hypothetical protein n=1 Tax=Peribacillus sedimenti TaxID=3115297 RepID=UPI0039063438